MDAVRSMRRGVERFSDQLALVASHARRDIQRREGEILEEQRRRHSELRRREHEVEVIQGELARCRQGCEGLMSALRKATALRDDAVEAYRRAQKAAALAAEAKSDLFRTLRKTDSTVEGQSKAASSALARLEMRISEVTRTHSMDFGTVAVGLVTIAQIATAVPDLARLGGNVAAALGDPNSFSNSSAAEAVAEARQQLVGFWADQQIHPFDEGEVTVKGEEAI